MSLTASPLISYYKPTQEMELPVVPGGYRRGSRISRLRLVPCITVL
jgi:hypothetical protein